MTTEIGEQPEERKPSGFIAVFLLNLLQTDTYHMSQLWGKTKSERNTGKTL